MKPSSSDIMNVEAVLRTPFYGLTFLVTYAKFTGPLNLHHWEFHCYRSQLQSKYVDDNILVLRSKVKTEFRLKQLTFLLNFSYLPVLFVSLSCCLLFLLSTVWESYRTWPFMDMMEY